MNLCPSAVCSLLWGNLVPLLGQCVMPFSPSFPDACLLKQGGRQLVSTKSIPRWAAVTAGVGESSGTWLGMRLCHVKCFCGDSGNLGQLNSNSSSLGRLVLFFFYHPSFLPCCAESIETTPSSLAHINQRGVRLK